MRQEVPCLAYLNVMNNLLRCEWGTERDLGTLDTATVNWVSWLVVAMMR